MTNVNPNHQNKRKSDIFPWGVFKSDVIYWLQNNKMFQ